MNDGERQLRGQGRRVADVIVAAQDSRIVAKWRRQIEEGWQEAERGYVVDGPTALSEIRERVTARVRTGHEPGGEGT